MGVTMKRRVLSNMYDSSNLVKKNAVNKYFSCLLTKRQRPIRRWKPFLRPFPFLCRLAVLPSAPPTIYASRLCISSSLAQAKQHPNTLLIKPKAKMPALAKQTILPTLTNVKGREGGRGKERKGLGFSVWERGRGKDVSQPWDNSTGKGYAEIAKELCIVLDGMEPSDAVLCFAHQDAIRQESYGRLASLASLAYTSAVAPAATHHPTPTKLRSPSRLRQHTWRLPGSMHCMEEMRRDRRMPIAAAQ
jgi:hypothetical protein